VKRFHAGLITRRHRVRLPSALLDADDVRTARLAGDYRVMMHPIETMSWPAARRWVRWQTTEELNAALRALAPYDAFAGKGHRRALDRRVSSC
jgi:hypothetical protein